MAKKDSVQETDLTSSDIYSYDPTNAVDETDFFEIAKTDKEYKISATNLILGLLKFAPVYLQGPPSDFVENAPGIELPFTEIDGENVPVNLSEIHNKQITISSPLGIQPNAYKVFRLSLNIDMPNNSYVFLCLTWSPQGGDKTNTFYFNALGFGAEWQELISPNTETAFRVQLAQGWYKVRGSKLIKVP